MADFYCYVVNGVIERCNIQKPKAHGNTAFRAGVTDDELAEHGYFPIVGEPTAYDSAMQRLEGPVYAVGDGVVTRTYQVVPRSADDLRAEAKQARDAAVAAITVTVNGKVFDGDERSQERMARALKVSDITGINETVWVLHDNTAATVTRDELAQALALAMQAQGDIWVV